MGHIAFSKYNLNIMKLLWILCALVALFAMVVAVPMGEKGEVGSLLSENIQDMEVAESKAIGQKSCQSRQKRLRKKSNNFLKALHRCHQHLWNTILHLFVWTECLLSYVIKCWFYGANT